jgi:hypothetical protein
MQSTTAIAFRALVMLVFLICIPMFAIFGKDVPNVLKGLVEGRGLVLGPAPGESNGPKVATPLPSANNPFGEPAPYRAASNDSASANGLNRAAISPATKPFPSASPALTPPANVPAPASAQTLMAQNGPYPGAPNAPASPAAAMNQIAPGQSAPPQNLLAQNTPMPTGAPSSDWRVPPAAASVQPAGYQAAPPTAAMPTEFSLREPQPGSPTGAPAQLQSLNQPPPLETVPSNQAAAAFPPSTARMAATAKPDVAAAVRTEEKFRTAETRLRELGASRYTLEAWGQDNSQYRFACDMSVPGSSMQRHFEAYETDPWRAMDSVVQQVEQWRGAFR